MVLSPRTRQPASVQVPKDGSIRSWYTTGGRNVPCKHWMSFGDEIAVLDELRNDMEMQPELNDKWNSWAGYQVLYPADGDKFITMPDHDITRMERREARPKPALYLPQLPDLEKVQQQQTTEARQKFDAKVHLLQADPKQQTTAAIQRFNALQTQPAAPAAAELPQLELLQHE